MSQNFIQKGFGLMAVLIAGVGIAVLGAIVLSIIPGKDAPLEEKRVEIREPNENTDEIWLVDDNRNEDLLYKFPHVWFAKKPLGSTKMAYSVGRNEFNVVDLETDKHYTYQPLRELRELPREVSTGVFVLKSYTPNLSLLVFRLTPAYYTCGPNAGGSNVAGATDDIASDGGCFDFNTSVPGYPWGDYLYDTESQKLTFLANGNPVRWDYEKNSLYFNGWRDETVGWALYKIDTDTKEVSLVDKKINADADSYRGYPFENENQLLTVESWWLDDEGPNVSIMTYIDKESGEKKEIDRSSGTGLQDIYLSPDGKRVMYKVNRIHDGKTFFQIMLFDSETKETGWIDVPPTKETFCSVSGSWKDKENFTLAYTVSNLPKEKGCPNDSKYPININIHIPSGEAESMDQEEDLLTRLKNLLQ